MRHRRRLLSLWLPRFAAERRAKREGLIAPPLAIAGERRGTQEVVSLTEAAEAAGVVCGMGLSDARAVAPSLLTRSETPEREAAAMAALARWAERWSPFVAVEEAGDGLILDATGCAHLFGGEAAIFGDKMLTRAQVGRHILNRICRRRGNDLNGINQHRQRRAYRFKVLVAVIDRDAQE